MAFGEEKKASAISGYARSVAKRLFIVEDDLMFGQRARAAAHRLGLEPTVTRAAAAAALSWQEGDVVLLQATLKPERQLALVEHMASSRPAPIIVAVTGHLETDLRRRLRDAGAHLATHSGIDTPLARALGISAGAGRDDARDDHARSPH